MNKLYKVETILVSLFQQKGKWNEERGYFVGDGDSYNIVWRIVIEKGDMVKVATDMLPNDNKVIVYPNLSDEWVGNSYIFYATKFRLASKSEIEEYNVRSEVWARIENERENDYQRSIGSSFYDPEF
jgi:hypothetical protein